MGSGDMDPLQDGESRGGCGGKASAAELCSICLEPVIPVTKNGDRSCALLQCGHKFHLDCIGSAFNAKVAMQCPNCRRVEKGQWLYASGLRSLPEFNMDDWAHDEEEEDEEAYDDVEEEEEEGENEEEEEEEEESSEEEEESSDEEEELEVLYDDELPAIPPSEGPTQAEAGISGTPHDVLHYMNRIEAKLQLLESRLNSFQREHSTWVKSIEDRMGHMELSFEQFCQRHGMSRPPPLTQLPHPGDQSSPP